VAAALFCTEVFRAKACHGLLQTAMASASGAEPLGTTPDQPPRILPPKNGAFQRDFLSSGQASGSSPAERGVRHFELQFKTRNARQRQEAGRNALCSSPFAHGRLEEGLGAVHGACTRARVLAARP